MYEREKLKEARYFMQCMEVSIDDPQAFRYNLSAFLSAARSVSQYAREEAKKKSNGLQWYNAQVASNEVLKFFKDMRDWNIHVEPVRPSRHIAVIVNERIRISEPVRVLMQKEDGATEVLEQKEEPSKPNVQETSGEVRIRYVLMDWGGSEDAVSLSHQYLAALENFVKAGLSNGVISG